MKKIRIFLMLLVITPVAGLLAACGTPAIERIYVASEAHKVRYTLGEGLDVARLEIGVVKDDGSIDLVAVLGEWVTGFDPNTLGEQRLTITYEGKEAKYSVEVVDLVDVFKWQAFNLKSSEYKVDNASIHGKYNLDDSIKIIKEILAENSALASSTSSIWLEIFTDTFTGGQGIFPQLLQAFYDEYEVKEEIDTAETFTAFESLLKNRIAQHMGEYGVGYMASEAAFNTGMNNLAEYVLAFNVDTYAPFASYLYTNPTKKSNLTNFFKTELSKEYNGKSLKASVEDAYDALMTRIIRFAFNDFEFMQIRKTGPTFEKMTFSTFYGQLFANQSFHLNEVTGEIIFLTDETLNDKFEMKEVDDVIDVKLAAGADWNTLLGFSDSRFKDETADGEIVSGEFEKYKHTVLDVRGVFIKILDSVSIALEL